MLARNSLKLLLPALNRESAAGAGSPRARQLPSALFAPRAPGTPTASHPRCYSTRTAIHENMFRRVARVGSGGEKPLPAQRGGARPPLIRGMPVPLPPSRRGGCGGKNRSAARGGGSKQLLGPAGSRPFRLPLSWRHHMVHLAHQQLYFPISSAQRGSSGRGSPPPPPGHGH